MEFIALYPMLNRYNMRLNGLNDNRYTMLYTFLTLFFYILIFIKQFGFSVFKIKICEYFQQLFPEYLTPLFYIVFTISIFVGLYLSYTKLSKNKMTVFGNLPYNISTKILTSLILLDKWPPWYESLIFMFQKEVADRIISEINTSNYGRLSILSNWKLDISNI